MIAPHYARPMPRSVTNATVVRSAPSDDAEQVTALSPGAVFAVLEFAGGWAWGFAEDGHLVGYVPASALGDASR